jgi:hypothetical protein
MNIQEAMELLQEANIITKAGHVVSVRDPQIDISQEGIRAIGKELDKVFKKFLQSNMRDTLPSIRVDIALDRTSKGRKRNR